MWTARERFAAVLAGEVPDRPLVTAWGHNRADEYPGGPLAAWTAETARRWDWDWIKVNPRATYYGEIWGNTYRRGDYEQRDIPRQLSVAVDTVADLDRIGVATGSDVLEEQVRLIGDVHALAPDVPVVQTLFSPLSALIQLAGLSYYPGKPVFGAGGHLTLEALFTEDPAATHRALRNITDTFVGYVESLRAAGADGIFYALTGTAHRDVASPERFAEFSAPYDHEVLEAAAGMARILHTCGPDSAPDRFVGWGMPVSWDQYEAGNPSLDDLDAAVVVGGVDHRSFTDPDAVAAQARAAAAVAERRPTLITPTCSVLSTAVTDAALAALADARRASDE